jgi:hypothetical protein
VGGWSLGGGGGSSNGNPGPNRNASRAPDQTNGKDGLLNCRDAHHEKEQSVGEETGGDGPLAMILRCGGAAQPTYFHEFGIHAY